MDYENIRVTELKALARELELRGYSRLRKAELIALFHPAPRPRPPRLSRPPPPPLNWLGLDQIGQDSRKY